MKRAAPIRRLTTARARNAELERSAQRLYRERLRSRLRAIRAEQTAVRRAKALALAKIKAGCARSRSRARSRIREARAAALRALRAESQQLLGAARRACALRTGKLDKRSARAQQRLEREARALAHEMAAEKLYRSGQHRTGKRSRAESDDEVRANLDAELVPVFESVRSSIAESPKKSRTEAFLQWVEENPDEVLRIRADLGEREFERELSEHLARERKIDRLLRRKRKPIQAAELLEVDISPDEVAAAGLDPSRPEDVRLYVVGPDAGAAGADEVPF